MIARVLVVALSLRALALAGVMDKGSAFAPNLFSDDLGYLSFARVYAAYAQAAYDQNAFDRAAASVGGVTTSPFFFFLNGALLYVFHSELALRVVSVVVASLSVWPIYDTTKSMFGDRAARVAAWLFAVMPYYVMVSCFILKDTWVLLLFMLGLQQIASSTRRLSGLFVLLLVCPLLEGLRTGSGVFLIVLLGAVVLRRVLRSPARGAKLPAIFGGLLAIGLLIFFGMLIFRITGASFAERVASYETYGRSDAGALSLLRVDDVSELYRLPLAYAASVILPLNLSFEFTGWLDVLSAMNYLFIPVGVAHVFYLLFIRKQGQRLIVYALIALHSIVVVTSLGIVRHYYFLHGYVLSCAARFLSCMPVKVKWVYPLCVVAVYVALLIAIAVRGAAWV